jgi:threonylcarbamoyladenosine tRNA methylthiotransferase MtaB
VQAYLATGQRVVDIAPHQKGEIFEELPLEAMPDRTRAFVKIEDGCNRRCAYCIIPTARGPVRSRSEANIIAELHTLAAAGHREVVFTGINLPSYGKDTGTNLADIVEKAAQVPDIKRIRLSSLDPDLITEGQVRRFASVEKLCPSFHLSLQSGCNATLRRMRRPYTTAQYAEAVNMLRTLIPDASLTTDVIVGFPGEDEEEFAQSLSFVRQMQFLKVHIFPFSPRPGTPAATMENQTTPGQRNARTHAMQITADAERAAWIAVRKSETHEVLLETRRPDGQYTGYTKNYIPILVPAPGHNQNDIVKVALGTFNGEHCAATLAK